MKVVVSAVSAGRAGSMSNGMRRKPTNGALLCDSISKRTKEPCKCVALKGATKCKYHGGPQQRKAMLQPVSISPRGEMRYNSEHLGATVKNFVRRELETDPREQVLMYEELAHLRQVIATALDNYYIAKEAADKAPDGDKGVAERNLLLRAKIFLQTDIDHAAKLAERISKIENNGADKFSIHTFNAIINQIVRIVGDHVGEAKVLEIEQDIANEVRMPTGTEAIVDAGVLEEDMRAMLDSVPYVAPPESEDE